MIENGGVLSRLGIEGRVAEVNRHQGEQAESSRIRALQMAIRATAIDGFRRILLFSKCAKSVAVLLLK